MNYKKILITVVAIISLILLVGCNKKVEVQVNNDVKVPDFSKSDENEDVPSEKENTAITSILLQAEGSETLTSTNNDNTAIEIENRVPITDNSIIKPTKVIKVTEGFKENLSKAIKIMKTTEDDWILGDDVSYFEIYEFFYEQNMSDYFKANTVFEKDLKTIVETTKNNMYLGGIGGDAYYQEELYKATSTLNAEGYNYSSNNLNSLNFETAWVEGVKGHGIGEKITLRMQEYGWVDPCDFGFIGSFEEGYRVMTEEEFNKSDSSLFYEKDEDRYLTYQEYLNNTKELIRNDTDNGYYNTLTGFYIVNGYAKNEEVFKANSRVKKLKLTLDGKEEYIIELEDTMNPQLIDIVYKQEPSFEVFNPIEATFEILEVYPGDKYEDTCITSLIGCVDTNMSMGG